MRPDPLALDGIELPGRAGQLRRQRATGSLVRELGDNYAGYHAHLAAELDKIGRPTRERYPDREEFLAAWARVQALVRAEATLRACVAYRRHGRPLDKPLEVGAGIPPLTSGDRLVPVEGPKR